MEVFAGILFSLFVLFELSRLADNNFEKKHKKLTEHYLLNANGFSLTHKIVSLDGNFGLAFDDDSKKVCLVENQNDNPFIRVISYRDLISSEIFQDGEMITSSVRSSNVGGALLGGLVFGNAGAIIGGISGKTKSSNAEFIKKISLRLVVNDINKPRFEIDFLNVKNGLQKKDSIYKDAIQKVEHWHSLIEILIKRADMEDKENEKNNVVQNSSNLLADELKKLAELRDTGVLSDAEFQKQKEKLLGL
jgi:hypothetical protein